MSVNLECATLDFDREHRQGVAEIIYGQGKTAAHIVEIATALRAQALGPVIATRISAELAVTVLAGAPGGEYDELARLIVWPGTPRNRETKVVIACAGTADLPVAHEARGMCAALGLSVDFIVDVGVAHLARVQAAAPRLNAADVVVAVAGMEGALASAIGGMVAAPVIAVPTSTGYGAALEGVTALLAMMTSCAAGVTVVNIDSGFAAAMVAHRFAVAMERKRGAE